MADKINVASLGDSIATGTLTPFQGTYSYVYYLQKKLREKGCQPDVFHLARDGDTTRDMLWKLNNSYQYRKIVKNADFITISIGGNDLLRASSIPGFTSINVHMANHGTKEFIRNWPQIVDKIKSINPKVEIVVLNLYNPYNQSQYLGRSYFHDRNLFELTDEFLMQINSSITAYSEHHYRIADVHAAFKKFSKGNMHKVSCLYPYSVMRNPHPTSGAQRMIADLVFDQFDWQ